MITASSGLLSAIESETRNPTAKLEIDWNMNVASGEWADISVYDFDDESLNIKSIEIYTEMGGDSDQYSTSDFDCELINSNNRYTPKANKNLLKNSGFELGDLYWTYVATGLQNIEVIDDTARSGRKYLKMNNPIASGLQAYSDKVDIFTTDGYHFVTNSEAKWYTLSFYVIASGLVSIALKAYNQSASGVNNLNTGFVTGAVSSLTF